MSKKLIRFDWAIKKLLRDKANFVILEGFLSVVLNQDIKIVEILESESNQQHGDDKFNRVDILVKNTLDEFIIIEIQNNKDYDYFQRILYGTSKVISEQLEKAKEYAEVKKVYSITVAYFDLGQGTDYVYYGKTEFTGIHNQNEVLALSAHQKKAFSKKKVLDIFPEYYIIKANKFDDQVGDKLDEWIYFLKNSEIKDEFTAQGLEQAREVLAEVKMTPEERKAYMAYQKRLRDIASENFTRQIDLKIALDEKYDQGLEKGIEQGKSERNVEIAKKSIEKGLDDQTISTITGLTVEAIKQLRKN